MTRVADRSSGDRDGAESGREWPCDHHSQSEINADYLWDLRVLPDNSSALTGDRW